MTTEPLLTDAEHELVTALGEVWNSFCRVVGNGPTRDHDLAEIVAHVHALQHKVMAQAAARAYPGRYRLLGQLVDDQPRPEPDVSEMRDIDLTTEIVFALEPDPKVVDLTARAETELEAKAPKKLARWFCDRVADDCTDPFCLDHAPF